MVQAQNDISNIDMAHTRIQRIKRAILGKFYNRLSLYLATSGIAIISYPFWIDFIIEWVKKEFNLELPVISQLPEFGIAIIVLALVYNIYSRSQELKKGIKHISFSAEWRLRNDLANKDLISFFIDLNNSALEILDNDLSSLTLKLHGKLNRQRINNLDSYKAKEQSLVKDFLKIFRKKLLFMSFELYPSPYKLKKKLIKEIKKYER